MESGASIEQMQGMTIGDINDLEKAQMLIHGVVEKQKTSIKNYTENKKLNQETAEEILTQLNY